MELCLQPVQVSLSGIFKIRIIENHDITAFRKSVLDQRQGGSRRAKMAMRRPRQWHNAAPRFLRRSIQDVDHGLLPRAENETHLNEMPASKSGINLLPTAILVLQGPIHQQVGLLLHLSLPRRSRLATALAAGIEGDQTLRRQLDDLPGIQPVDKAPGRSKSGHTPALPAFTVGGIVMAQFL